MPAESAAYNMRFMGRVTSHSAGKMDSSIDPCSATTSRWFVAVQKPLAVLAAVLMIALPVTTRAQAPIALAVGSDSPRGQLQKVLKNVPAQPSPQFSEVTAAPCSGHSAISPSASPKPLSAAEECSMKPKDVFKECEKCPEVIVVPAGEFNMGSPEDEPDRNKNESPQHIVRFARQFAVGRFAVTFDEWDACVADGGCNGYIPSDNGWGRGNRPVIHVSWTDAQAYVAWLSSKTGKTYRLLTEAEREYVTRAGTTTPFWFGSTISLEQANFDDKHPYNNSPPGGRRGETLPVDSFAPNPWGLYQVHGNVWDWVEDCFNDSYVGSPSDGSAWTSGGCDKHVLRGGAWIDQPRFLRSAFRLRDVTSRRYNLQGFRVARPLSP
jgi:formylglycine-generating enzyme required for sulfatase activity